jgi:rhodanese-related sulfurtransferase
MGMRHIFAIFALSLALAAPAFSDDLRDEIVGYMDFATYDSGILVPQQITQEVFDAAVFVDTRDADQFAAGTIPGAVNIEWREIPARLDEVSDASMVILFCNTGSLSAQATFAARLMGYENVVVLQTGLNGWRETAAYMPQ